MLKPFHSLTKYTYNSYKLTLEIREHFIETIQWGDVKGCWNNERQQRVELDNDIQPMRIQRLRGGAHLIKIILHWCTSK